MGKATFKRNAQEPKRPTVTKNNSYDPKDLLRFLDECDVFHIETEEIVQILRVPRHRIIYFQGAGRQMLERKSTME